MVWIYSDLCFAKKIVRLEKLDRDIKNRMWANVRDMCSGKTDDQNKLIQICKAFYVIEFFLNEKIC
jgi:hypothetical protein